MRHIVKLILLCACLLSGCGPSAKEVADEHQRAEQARADEQRARYKAAIEHVLISDQKAAAIIDLAERVRTMQAIDTSECPAEFRSAYLDHIYAWLDLSRVRQARDQLASDGSIEDTLLRSVVASANNSDDTPIEDLLRSDGALERLAQNTATRINDTFHTVQRIAIQYGATLPT